MTRYDDRTLADLTCDDCGLTPSSDQAARGWPIVTLEETLICAHCYDGGVCPEGHVMPADDEGDDCPHCAVQAALSGADADDGRSMLDVVVDATDLTLAEIERELSRMGYSRVEYTRRSR